VIEQKCKSNASIAKKETQIGAYQKGVSFRHTLYCRWASEVV